MKTVTFDETKFKLVPLEPTSEMLRTLSQEWHHSRYEPFRARYRDMIAAAPAQPPQDEQRPAGWWNGLRAYDEEDYHGPSYSAVEDTNHDIPLYSGVNPHSAVLRDAERIEWLAATAFYHGKPAEADGSRSWFTQEVDMVSTGQPTADILRAAIDAEMLAAAPAQPDN